MQPISFEAFARIVKLADNHPDIVEAVRDSFHSLIGDFWVAFIENRSFRSSAGSDTSLPVVRLWDTAVPTPNLYTALAWFFIVESGEGVLYGRRKGDTGLATRFVGRLPTSLNPREHSVQVRSLESSINTSDQLPQVSNLRAHMERQGSQIQTATASQATNRMHYLNYTWNGETHVLSEPQNVQHILTDVRMEPERHKILIERRLAMMRKVLVRIENPMSAANMFDCRGISIRDLTDRGLYVAACKTESRPTFLTNGGSVAAGTKMGPLELNSVPYATPPVWLGFNLATREGRLAALAWHKAYADVRHGMAHRLHAAINRIDTDKFESLGVTNPDWMQRLTEAGSAMAKVDSGGSSGRKKSERDLKLDSMQAAFDRFLAQDN